MLQPFPLDPENTPKADSTLSVLGEEESPGIGTACSLQHGPQKPIPFPHPLGAELASSLTLSGASLGIMGSRRQEGVRTNQCALVFFHEIILVDWLPLWILPLKYPV